MVQDTGCYRSPIAKNAKEECRWNISMFVSMSMSMFVSMSIFVFVFHKQWI